MHLRKIGTAILLTTALAAGSAFAQTAGNIGPAELSATRDAPSSLPGEATPMPPLQVDSSTMSRGPMALDPSAAIDSMGTETLNNDGSTESRPASEMLRALLEQQMPGSEAASTDRLVIGTDDRQQITEASGYPERIVGWLWVQTQDDVWSTCSSTLIGPYTVVTAAHCVYLHGNGGWIKDMMFYPGVTDPNIAPFGSYTWENINILKGFIENYDGNYGSAMPWDLAVITLAEDAGNQLGWMGFRVDEVAGWAANIIGYPVDKPAGTMWKTTCDVKADQIADLVFWYDCDLFPGNSGSAVWEDQKGDLYVRGIFVASDEKTTNIGARFTEAYYQFIVDNYK